MATLGGKPTYAHTSKDGHPIGKFYPHPAVVATGNIVLTADDVLNYQMYSVDPSGSSRTVTLPTAAALLAKIQKKDLGYSFDWVIRNNSGSVAEVLTLTTNTGLTIKGPVLVDVRENVTVKFVVTSWTLNTMDVYIMQRSDISISVPRITSTSSFVAAGSPTFMVLQPGAAGTTSTLTVTQPVNPNLNWTIPDTGVSCRFQMGVTQVKTITATSYNLLAIDSGSLVVLAGGSAATAALPAVAAGLKYTIVIGSAQNHIINGGATVIKGIVAGFPTGTTTTSLHTTGGSSYTGNSTPSIGDRFDFWSDGTTWFVSALVFDATKYTPG